MELTANWAVSWSMPTCTQPSSDARSKMPEGIALPCPWSLKSCTRTGLGEPLGRHSRPPFLKSPTNSFFLVSTEITGSRASSALVAVVLRCWNWASRSGCAVLSRTLRFACRLEPSPRNSRATVSCETQWPPVRSSSRKRRTRVASTAGATPGRRGSGYPPTAPGPHAVSDRPS